MSNTVEKYANVHACLSGILLKKMFCPLVYALITFDKLGRVCMCMHVHTHFTSKVRTFIESKDILTGPDKFKGLFEG